MSLKDCLDSAVAQGAINSRQAEELGRYYEARFKRKRPGMTDAEARIAARDEVVSALRTEAKEARRQVLLAEANRKEVAAYVEDFRDLHGREDKLDAALSLMIHNGYKGTNSMAGKGNAIIAMAHRKLADVMYHFSRTKISGRYRNSIDLPDLMHALHNEKIDNPAVSAMAGAVREVLEDLRIRFNEAGGNIPKREDHGLPHSHQRQAIRDLGAYRTKLGRKRYDLDKARQQWKNIIRPLLDVDVMTNPKTGDVIGPDGIDGSLDYVFDSIMSDNWAHRVPEARRFGKGKVANRYQDSRFLIFRDADAWLTYNKQFGKSDPISAIFNHINGMARDIAAMERFGPNPDATIEWLKQAVQADIGKQQAGLIKSAADKVPGLSAVAGASYRIDSLWRALRGRETVWEAPVKFSSDVRNIVTSAVLGATGILANLTDPFVAASARRLAGLPVTSTAVKMLKTFARDKDKRAMARRVVIWDDFMHTMNEEARFVDQMFGHDWSRWLVDRALTINALKPLTEARKRTEAGAWHETLGGYAEKDTDWIDLHPLLKKTMEGFGLGADEWHKMRAGVDEMGFLDPGGVLDRTGDQELAEAYAEMIIQWQERSVPSGDPRLASIVTGVTPRGTIAGDLIDFSTQFKSFAMSFTARQLEAHYVYSMMAKSSLGKVARGGYYFAALAVPLTLGAAVYQQSLALLNGQDLQDMTEASFWIKSFVKGGGGGLFADFIDSAQNRFGSSLASTIPGPGVAFIGDTLDMTLKGVHAIIAGISGDEEGLADAKIGKTVTDYVGRYTPVLSSHPATRLAYRRLLLDNLQWAIDPDADASFKAKARRNSAWWEPGNLTPTRLPDLAAVMPN